MADELTAAGLAVDPIFSVAWLYGAQYELAAGDLPAARTALEEAERLDSLYPELGDAAPPEISAQMERESTPLSAMIASTALLNRQAGCRWPPITANRLQSELADGNLRLRGQSAPTTLDEDPLRRFSDSLCGRAD